jgi:hypothetical protein
VRAAGRSWGTQPVESTGCPSGAKRVDVPLNRLVEPFLEAAPRLPVQLALRERGVDGVAAIVAESIGDKRNQALRFVERLQKIFTRSTGTISSGVVGTGHVELFAIFARDRGAANDDT